MKYTVFGKTGLQVSQVALGTGNFGTGWGYGADPDVAEAIFNAYAEAGGNFIDTADVYQFGQSEELLGTLLKGLGTAADRAGDRSTHSGFSIRGKRLGRPPVCGVAIA